jgi:hypothetical protein
MNRLKTYPLYMVTSFCGDFMWKDEFHTGVNNDIGRECRHGFGHAIYLLLAVRETGGTKTFSVCKQFRPAAGFQLSKESMCEGYRICLDSPNDKAFVQCRGVVNHSYKIVGSGESFDHEIC